MRAVEFAIAAQGVRKNYAGAPEGAGLNGFDLQVPAGTVCGLLGPNGAGKTTAIRVLATLLRLDSGRASVAGFDVRAQPRQVRERIGLVGQYAAVDEILTGRQNLVMFARLSHFSSAAAKRRADELLERFSLADTGKQPVAKYSGGMRRRLDLAASLIVAPPGALRGRADDRAGSRPAAGRSGRRSEIWPAPAPTVLLTTQYLEEADRLADRISMLRAGRVVTEGTPEELKSALGGDWLDLVLADAEDVAATEAIAGRIASGEVRVDGEARRVSVPVAERTRALVTMATALGDAGVEPIDITLRRPTLDEVFLHLMGDQAVIDDRAATDDRAGEPPGGGGPGANRPASAGPFTGTEVTA